MVRGILPKRHNDLESPTVYVLVTDNKFIYNQALAIKLLELFNKCRLNERL